MASPLEKRSGPGDELVHVTSFDQCAMRDEVRPRDFRQYGLADCSSLSYRPSSCGANKEYFPVRMICTTGACPDACETVSAASAARRLVFTTEKF